MSRLKVVVAGPCQAGKSTIANFLADATEMSTGDYAPTQGVRILEFETRQSGDRGATRIEVELWDCSGNHKFENGWPCIQQDVNGVLLVYNGSEASHGKELETWHLHFVRQPRLNAAQCLVFKHAKPGASESARAKLSSTFSDIEVVETNLEDDPEEVREKFASFVSTLLGRLKDKRDAEELSIVNRK